MGGSLANREPRSALCVAPPIGARRRQECRASRKVSTRARHAAESLDNRERKREPSGCLGGSPLLSVVVTPEKASTAPIQPGPAERRVADRVFQIHFRIQIRHEGTPRRSGRPLPQHGLADVDNRTSVADAAGAAGGRECGGRSSGSAARCGSGHLFEAQAAGREHHQGRPRNAERRGASRAVSVVLQHGSPRQGAWRARTSLRRVLTSPRATPALRGPRCAGGQRSARSRFGRQPVVASALNRDGGGGPHGAAGAGASRPRPAHDRPRLVDGLVLYGDPLRGSGP